MPTIAGWILAVLTAAALNAAVDHADYQWPPSVDTSGEDGSALFRRDCVSCHGPAGEGTRRGPSLEEVGEAAGYYYLHTGRMPISDPREAIRRSPVPYTDEQLLSLVEYTADLGSGEPMPVLEGREGEVAAGGVHFRLHCSVCHGAAGQGGALAQGGYAPSLWESEPEDVVAAVVTGPGAMPSFTTTLDDSEIIDVAAYVSHLQSPPGVAVVSVPGGRVGEGLVAMAATLLLIGAARLIGEKT